VILALRASRAWSVDPVEYLQKWSRRSRGLAEGLILHEDGLNQIGIPAHIARDPNRRFGIDEVTDQSMALLEQTKAEYAKPGATPQFGLRIVVTDEGPIPGHSTPTT
jgi:hypothetical protein